MGWWENSLRKFTKSNLFIIILKWTDGNCLESRKEKNLCQKCRFDRCLEIGMDSKFILSEDEKRDRFKNYFKKKDEVTILTKIFIFATDEDAKS